MPIDFNAQDAWTSDENVATFPSTVTMLPPASLPSAPAAEVYPGAGERLFRFACVANGNYILSPRTSKQ